jgi:hypothetical protein
MAHDAMQKISLSFDVGCLDMGHDLSISAFWKAASASGVC